MKKENFFIGARLIGLPPFFTYRIYSVLRLLRNCTMLPIIASDKNAP